MNDLDIYCIMIGKMSSPLILMVCFLCIAVVFIAYDEFYIKDDDKVLFWIVFAIIICFLFFLLLCPKYVEANDDDYRKLAGIKKEFPELGKDFEKAMQDNVITLEEANEIFKKEIKILKDREKSKVVENIKDIKDELKGGTNGN